MTREDVHAELGAIVAQRKPGRPRKELSFSTPPAPLLQGVAAAAGLSIAAFFSLYRFKTDVLWIVLMEE
jgi:hypothetical protein